MSRGADPGASGSGEADRPLIVDELTERLEHFHLLTDTDEESDRILGELGGSGKVEKEMLAQLAATRPLAYPERFWAAHSVAMRALEVLARNGAREPSQLSAGFLTPVARWAVQQFIRYIVRQHQGQVVDAIRDLYVRRIAWTPVSDPARQPLVRARVDVERAAPSYKKKAGGIPTAIVGGAAAASSVAQVARGWLGNAVGSQVGLVVAGALAFLILAAVSWVILRAAAIARRRITLTMDRPLAALWETVGWAGRPPRDSARAFAAIAIVITVLGWILIPLAAVAIFTVF